MARIIVNPGTAGAWELELREGANRFGRSGDSDVALDHASISAEHAEIVLRAGAATLRDLGSVNGTFAGGQLVERTALVSGQRFRLGDIEIEFAGDAPPPAVAAAPASVHCRFHPKDVARWRCPKCGHAFCELCVSGRGGGAGRFCRACGSECEPMTPANEVQEVPTASAFWLADAFAYPFKGNGPMLLGAGTVFFVLLAAARFLAGLAPLFGGLAMLLLAVFGTGYLFSYAKSIIGASAGGEPALPDWPEISDLTEDILLPLGQLIGLLALSFGPVLLLRRWHPADPALTTALIAGALGVGTLLAPMGLLALALFDSVAALNPVVLVRAIARAPLPYFLVATVFEFVLGVQYVAKALLDEFTPIPFLPTLLGEFLSLYLLTAGMRLLGNFYDRHQERLGWFSRGGE